MKIGIFSDIHGNLIALEKVLKDEKDLEEYIILGDVVNYGPWSNECVQILETLNNCTKIIGNHENYFIKGKCNFNNNLANEFFKVCFESFTETENIKKYLKNYSLGNKFCTHTINNQYIYNDTKIKLDKNYLIGHSHSQFEISNNGYILINPGSVGQNRYFINVINYIIYETENDSIQYISKIYNVDLLINEMKIRNYPNICLNYYLNKPRK